MLDVNLNQKQSRHLKHAPKWCCYLTNKRNKAAIS